MSVRLSVITPVYNGAKYLAESVESALGNGFPDLEVLIIDDGSKDDSRAVAERLVDAHPERVRLLTHPGGVNRGISASRNLALETARGEWVAFLDSDDRLLPGHFADSVGILEGDAGVGVVYGRVRHIDADGKQPEVPVEWGSGPGRGRVPDPFRRLLSGNFIALPTSVCRLESVRRVGCFDVDLGSGYEDYMLWTKIACHDAIYYTDQCSAEYRMHPASYTWNFSRVRLASAEEVDYLHHVWAWLPAAAAEQRAAFLDAESEFGNRIAYRGYQAVRRGDLAQAFRELRCLGRLPHPGSLLKIPARWSAARKARGAAGAPATPESRS